MILDGYNEYWISPDGAPIGYRPLTPAERARWCAAEPESEVQEEVLEALLMGRIFHPASPQLYIRAHWSTVSGLLMGEPDKQRRQRQNLKATASLMVHYPHLLKTSCEQCRVWWYDPITGRTAGRQGNPLKRPPGSSLFCQTSVGCPKGTYEDPLVPLPENVAAVQHFRECEAADSFPDDPIVRQNAAIIRQALKETAC